MNLDLLATINDKVHAPLVLHGGSGIHEDDVRAAVWLGVVKINIGAALSRAWCQGSSEELEAGDDHYSVLRRAMRRVHEVAPPAAVDGGQRSRLTRVAHAECQSQVCAFSDLKHSCSSRDVRPAGV